MGNDLLIERIGHAGVLTLNRPKALNAITHGMISGIAGALETWRHDNAVNHVVIRQTGDKAFAAGGDIRVLYDEITVGRADGVLPFFRDEYRLNRAIKHYEKPYIALIDGIVMGGGVGVSIHGSHRVASEALTFAMPEVAIGFFPDVGATYLLPRLPGRLGMHLALTGERVKVGDALAAGIVTHHVPRSDFPALFDALVDSRDVDGTLAAFAKPVGEGPLAARLADIDRLYRGDSLGAVVAHMEAAAAGGDDVAAGIAGTLRQRSPTSLAIAFHQMAVGAGLSFEDCMRLEFRIVSRIVHGHDFPEGVRAVIVDKDNAPGWQPPRIEDLAPDTAARHAAPLHAGELDFPA